MVNLRGETTAWWRSFFGLAIALALIRLLRLIIIVSHRTIHLLAVLLLIPFFVLGLVVFELVLFLPVLVLFVRCLLLPRVVVAVLCPRLLPDARKLQLHYPRRWTARSALADVLLDHSKHRFQSRCHLLHPRLLLVRRSEGQLVPQLFVGGERLEALLDT